MEIRITKLLETTVRISRDVSKETREGKNENGKFRFENTLQKYVHL